MVAVWIQLDYDLWSFFAAFCFCRCSQCAPVWILDVLWLFVLLRCVKNDTKISHFAKIGCSLAKFWEYFVLLVHFCLYYGIYQSVQLDNICQKNEQI
jgi:hypothetical protein